MEATHEEWEILEIVDCRETRKFGVQYKAIYIGNWDEWNANPPWQPWTDFRKSIEKFLQYHKEPPRKPKVPEDITGMHQTIDNVRPSTETVDEPDEA